VPVCFVSCLAIFVIPASPMLCSRGPLVPKRVRSPRSSVQQQLSACSRAQRAGRDWTGIYTPESIGRHGAVPRALNERRTAALRDIPTTRSELAVAVGAMRDLVAQGERHHRVPLPDVILAATAASVSVGILHYGRHFDRLAEVLNFRSQWIVPRGSLLDEPAPARRPLRVRVAAAFRELRRA